MYAENNILVGANENTEVYLLAKLANRHGLIAGATGTGKTVTLKTLAEAFSDMGVPVFLADMKGDVSGLAKVGEPSSKTTERMKNTILPTRDLSLSHTLLNSGIYMGKKDCLSG
jgi:hypothetical protein